MVHAPTQLVFSVVCWYPGHNATGADLISQFALVHEHNIRTLNDLLSTTNIMSHTIIVACMYIGGMRRLIVKEGHCTRLTTGGFSFLHFTGFCFHSNIGDGPVQLLTGGEVGVKESCTFLSGELCGFCVLFHWNLATIR